MKILLRKALRDLGRSKMRTFSIIFSITLSVGLGIGLVNATWDSLESFDKRFEDTNYEDIDVRFEMTDVNLTGIESIDGVKTAIGRLFIQTQTEYDGTQYKTNWISAPYHDREPYSEINGYQMFKGDYLSSPGAPEALVGNVFAGENGMSPGDPLTVFYGNISLELEVSGLVGSPEYIYVVDEAGWPQPSLLMPVFTSYEMTAQALDLPPGTYNEVLVLVEDGYDQGEVKQAVEEHLSAGGVKITQSLLGTEELDYQFSKTDAGAMGSMGWVFGIIILSVTAVVIYNSLARLIASQRAYIGVMGALGGRTRDIVLHYCFFGFFMGVIGSTIGILVGIGISNLIVTAYADLLGLKDPVTAVNWLYPAAFWVIGVLIATGAAFLGALKAVRIGPREALTSGYHTEVFSKKPLLERLFDRPSKKKTKILSKVPLRNISRHRGRTAVTMLSLAFSLILVFTCLAMVYGFFQPLEKNYEEYERWDLRATLVERVDAGDAMADLAGPGMDGLRAEVHLDDFVPVQRGEKLEFAHVQAFEPDSGLRRFNVIDGKEDFSRGILVGSTLANNLNIDVGDSVTFLVGDATSSVKVTGITGELLDDSFLMTLAQADEHLLAGGTINSIIVDMGSESRDDTEEVLRENFPVGALAYTEDVIHGMESMMEGLVGMLGIFIIFGIVAEVLFVSTTVVLNIIDRKAEYLSLRALGMRPRKIYGLVVSETAIMLLGGLIIGLPLGYFATRWAMVEMTAGLMYYDMAIAPEVFILTVLIALVSAVLASLVSARHITREKLVDAIRERGAV